MTNIKRIRLEKKMTQVNIITHCGLAQSQYVNFEHKYDVENLTLKTVCKIAKGLDAKLCDVINDPNVIDALRKTDEYETGFLLDGEISPVAEIRKMCSVTQDELSIDSGISQPQICKWERYGMDGAKLKNFIDVANALRVNIRLLIWDSDLQNLYDEVTRNEN